MAPKAIKVGIVLVVLAFLCAVATAQSGCMSVIISMASCLNYVSGSTPTPSASCCSALANVVQTQPRCLCTIVNGGGGSLGVNINQTLALGLPSACKVETPPISRCNESAPPESGDGIPSAPTTPSVTGSKTTPSSGTTSNRSTKMNVLGVFTNVFLFTTVSYAFAAFNNVL
ncbi:non-specific lipid-transfer protein-like protein At2g13820 isoform X2 [Sesamum indicum]|uniref:Non-specific lipid-transfer protein-like protein At2g13820 isoform X2 n=1 Tax=Sesamum indicum TaxID=4182 RepID=A0A8M8V2G1_SESIN|nr:non-specific lipid-transfer protein-like protein At2g13820 isoform X2 [Sesamum indicum]